MFVVEIAHLFAKSPLLPAVIVEDATGEVLMLAYMNRESLERTLATGETWFFSRSRQALWHKGETSGHVQRVVRMLLDCEENSLLVRVRQTGVACHTGARSCFFNEIYHEDDGGNGDVRRG